MKKLTNLIPALGIIVAGALILTQSAFKKTAAYENYGQYMGADIPGVVQNGHWYQEGTSPATGYLFVCNSRPESECTFDFSEDPNSNPSSVISVNKDEGEFVLQTP